MVPAYEYASGISGDAARAQSLNFDLITTEPAFHALEVEWTGLFERSGRPEQVFQTFAWCRHWADAFLGSHGCATQLAILTGRSGGRLVMVWPLALNRIASLKELSWLGEPVSQYGDVLAEPGPCLERNLEAGWHHVMNSLRPSVVRLNKTRADSAIAPLLTVLGARITQDQQAPFVDLTRGADWATLEKCHFTSKSIKNRRRQTRRLEELGSVQFETYAAGPQARAFAVEAIELKRAWLAEKCLFSPAISNERTLRFFAQLAGNAALGHYVRCSALKVNGKTAAISLGFACKGRLTVHLIVYDGAFEKPGAGAVLMEKSVKQAFEDGFTVFDLLAPGGGYKHEWTELAAPVANYSLAPTVAGRLYRDAYLAVVRPRLKQAVEHLGALKRRMRAAKSLKTQANDTAN